MIETVHGDELESCLVEKYFNTLVNNFFKILPMKESNEQSLHTYVKSFCSELAGFKGLVPAIGEDPHFLSLLSILQFIIDNPDTPVADVKREVFKAIRICNKLAEVYSEGEVIS